MGIALENERKPGLPVVKRTALGEKFHGAIVKVEQRDRLKRDENTNAMVPLLKANNKPRQELVLTCVTLPGTTASVGLGENEFVPDEGQLVRLILKGKAFGDWIEQKAALGRPTEVGDIVTQTTDRAQVYDQNGNPTGNEITDQESLSSVPRGKSVGIYGPIAVRAPKANSPWIAKAEEAYHSLRETITAEETPSSKDDFDNDDDEPPF